MNEIPIVRICSNCQKEFNLDNSVKTATNEGIKFTHGMCKRHYFRYMKMAGISDDKINATWDVIVKKSGSEEKAGPPDLNEHPKLVSLYNSGIFNLQQYREKEKFKAVGGTGHSAVYGDGKVPEEIKKTDPQISKKVLMPVRV